MPIPTDATRPMFWLSQRIGPYERWKVWPRFLERRLSWCIACQWSKYTHARALTHTHTRARSHRQTHTQTHTNTHTHKHNTHIHTQSHTHARTRAHTHTHTHTRTYTEKGGGCFPSIISLPQSVFCHVSSTRRQWRLGHALHMDNERTTSLHWSSSWCCYSRLTYSRFTDLSLPSDRYMGFCQSAPEYKHVSLDRPANCTTAVRTKHVAATPFWSGTDQTARSNSRGAVYFACLSRRSNPSRVDRSKVEQSWVKGRPACVCTGIFAVPAFLQHAWDGMKVFLCP